MLRNSICALLLSSITGLASASGMSATAASAAPAKAPPPSRTLYRAVVVFNSWGAGVSRPTISTFNVIVAEYEANSGISLERHVVYWGREGEFNSCMPLSQLNASAQQNFVQDLRNNLEPGGRAFVLENAPCGD